MRQTQLFVLSAKRVYFERLARSAVHETVRNAENEVYQELTSGKLHDYNKYGGASVLGQNKMQCGPDFMPTVSSLAKWDFAGANTHAKINLTHTQVHECGMTMKMATFLNRQTAQINYNPF